MGIRIAMEAAKSPILDVVPRPTREGAAATRCLHLAPLVAQPQDRLVVSLVVSVMMRDHPEAVTSSQWSRHMLAALVTRDPVLADQFLDARSM